MRKYTLLTVLLVVIDQVIKQMIKLNFIPISYIKNTGGAFSIGFGNVSIFIVISIILIIAVILIKRFVYKDETIAFSLILAGGIGNLLDRAIRGYVIDYIDLTKIINFPVFNLADILIVLGAIILLIRILKRKEEWKNIELKVKMVDWIKQ